MSRVSKPRKHGKRWEISYYDAAGKRRWRSFPWFEEAQVALRLCRPRQMPSGARHIVHRDKTFDDLVELWKDVKHRKRSLEDDEGRIRNHLGPALTRL